MFKSDFLIRQTLIAVIRLAVVWQTVALPYAEADDKFERGRMQDVMAVVAKDIQKNFYDPSLKGVDWKAITDRARQRIGQADYLGDMLAAIASVPFQLNDSHTFFIPPGRSAKVDYGFEAEPFGKDILVYKLTKNGPAIKAGLEMGDKIVGIGGFAAKRENFFKMTRYFEFLNPANELELEILRGSDTPRTVKIPASVERLGKWGTWWSYNEMQRMYDDQEPIYRHRDYEGNVGYLKLRAFMLYGGEVDSMVKKVKNARSVIIDLRGNTGGARETLSSLAGHFTDKPYEMANQVGRDKTEALRVKPISPKIDVPVFVMIDSESASASEMFARDMQIRKRRLWLVTRPAGE